MKKRDVGYYTVRHLTYKFTNLQIYKLCSSSIRCFIDQRVDRPLTDTWQTVILTDKMTPKLTSTA